MSYPLDPEATMKHEYRPMRPCGGPPVPSDGLSTSNPSESATRGGASGECARFARPAAIALRLRVTQVVCGIVTCVLGAVACIEERGHFRLGSGLVAGALTVAASVASIHATFNDFPDRVRWIQYAASSGSGDCGAPGDTSFLLSFLWGGAVVSNMVTIAFAFMALASCNANLVIIGSLELGLGLAILAILVSNLLLAVHYRGLQRK